MGGGHIPTHERVGKLSRQRLNYQTELSELKSDVNLNIKLNTSKSQVNRYLENVLHRVVKDNLKDQYSPRAYINAKELVFDSGYG